MVFQRALLHHLPRSKTDENIRKSNMRVGAPKLFSHVKVVVG
jgi:hypothetical protein